jgi:glutamyl-tRNA reductase
MVEKAQAFRSDRPLLIVDLAVPRDVDPAVGTLGALTLADMDSLEYLVHDRYPLALSARMQAEAIVEEEVASFEQWLAERATVPVIRALYHRAEAIQKAELATAFNKLGDLSSDQRGIVECLASSIVGKLLHDPVTGLKSLTGEHQSAQLAVARVLFNLPDSPGDDS